MISGENVLFPSVDSSTGNPITAVEASDEILRKFGPDNKKERIRVKDGSRIGKRSFRPSRPYTGRGGAQFTAQRGG